MPLSITSKQIPGIDLVRHVPQLRRGPVGDDDIRLLLELVEIVHHPGAVNQEVKPAMALVVFPLDASG